MRKVLIATGLALGLAGCGDGAEAPNANVVNEAAADEDFGNRIAQLPEGQRNGVFIRAIRDSGEECQHVESSTRGADHQGYPTWSATCAGGGSYTIVITGGVAQVLNDAERQLVGGNETDPQNAQAQ